VVSPSSGSRPKPSTNLQTRKKKIFSKKKNKHCHSFENTFVVKSFTFYAFEWIRKQKEDLAKRRRKTEKVSKKKCLIEKELGRCG
jgi:hypothetical protein